MLPAFFMLPTIPAHHCYPTYMKKPVRKFRWFRRTLRVFAVVLILFIIACFVFDHYVQFRKSDEELAEIFRERGIDGRVGYYESGGGGDYAIRLSGPTVCRFYYCCMARPAA